MPEISPNHSRQPTESAPLFVFISYSHDDLGIADRIVAALKRPEIEPLIDRRHLPIAREWQDELAEMISQSDTVLWLVSEHSINSTWCQWELATLAKHQKRLVPVKVGPILTEALPDAIGNLQLADLTNAKTFDAEIKRLVDALLVPYEWVKDQKLLAEQAARPRFRLRGDELERAEQWLREKPDFAPQPSKSITNLITRSRRIANRNKNVAIAASVSGMIVALGVAWYSFDQWRTAQIAESQALALASSQITDEGDAASALLIALKGVPGEKDILKRPILPVSQRSIYKAMFSLREQRLFQGHRQALTHAEASGDGRQIVTSSEDGTARLWDANGGSAQVLDSHDGPVNMARFSPDMSRIVTVSDDGTGNLWSGEGEKIATLDRHTKPVLFTRYSKDGRYIVTVGEDYKAHLWSAANGDHIQEFRGHSNYVVAADISQDGTLLATASVDGTVRIWPMEGGEPIVRDEHVSRVLWVNFDHTGKYFATASRDGTAILWTSDGKLLKTLDRHKGVVSRIRFHPSAQLALSASDDNSAMLWDVITGDVMATLQGHEARVIEAAFSPDGRKILTASVDGAIGLWRLENDGGDFKVKRFATLRGHERDIVSARFSADGEWVISASKDHTARRWRATEDQSVAEGLIHKKDLRSFAFSSDGKWIVTAIKGGEVRIWNAETQEVMVERNLAPTTIISTAFSPDSSLIALAQENGEVSFYDRDTLEPSGPNLVGHEARVRSINFSPDGDRIVTSSADDSIRVWDKAARKLLLCVRHDDRTRSAVFSPDGKQIASVSRDRTIRLWDSESGELIENFKHHEEDVWAVAFSPDGKKIVTGSEDGQAFITTLDRKTSPLPLIGHGDNIRSAKFSADGRHVLTSSWDRTARLWDVATGEEIAIIPSEDIILDAAFDPKGGRIAHLVKNQLRFRPIYPTIDALIHAAKALIPSGRDARRR